MSTQTDIEIVQGETKVFTATWTIGGVAKPLTGYVAHLQMRKRPGSFTADPLVDISSLGTTPAIQLEPAGTVGLVRVRIPAQLTSVLKKNCWYSLFLVNGTDPSEAIRLMFGQVLISKSSTDNSTLNVTLDSPDLTP